MPTTVKVVQQFVPHPAIQGQAVTLRVASPPPSQIRVQINPTGVQGGTLTNVLTTAARHSELVNNLNSGNTVTVVVTTDSAGKVTDFASSEQAGTADHGDSGATSDSAIPL